MERGKRSEGRAEKKRKDTERAGEHITVVEVAMYLSRVRRKV